MADQDFSLGIETQIVGEPAQDWEQSGMPPPSDFGAVEAERQRAASLSGMNALGITLAGRVPYPNPSDPALMTTEQFRRAGLVDPSSGFAPSRQMLESDTALSRVFYPTSSGGYGGGRYGGPGGGGGDFGGGGGGGNVPGGDFADDGFSYNQRWRNYRQGPWHQNIDMGGVEDAQYADIVDVTGTVTRTGWHGALDSVRGMFSREAMSSPDMQFALGFGAMSTAQGLQRALTPLVSGEAYLPGQVAEQSATSTLPLLGALAGTLVGGRLGQPLAGQFIGQSVGSGAEDLIDQYTAGHTFAQQRAGEALGAGRGGASAVNDFTEALQKLTGATKDAADVFQKIGQTGPVTPGGAGGIAGLQPGLGTAFTPTVDTVARYLDSSPFLAQTRVRFGNNGFTSDDLFGQSLYAYAHGDFESGLALNAAGKARNVNANEFTDYARDEQINRDYQSEPWWQKAVGWHQGAAQEARQRMRSEPQYPEGFKPTDALSLAAQGEKLYAEYQSDQVSILTGQAMVRRDATGLQVAQLRGAGAAQLRGMLPSLNADLAAEGGAFESGIALDRDVLKQYPHDAALQAQTRADIAQLRGEEAGLGVQRYGLARAVMTEGLQERESAFRLGNLRDTLRGESNAAQAPGDLAYYRSLTTEARSLPYLSPSERDQLETQGLQGAYQTRMGVDAQALSQIDLRTDRAQTGLSHAGITGGPQDVFQAGQGVADAYTAKIRELTDELRKGGLALDDRIAKEGQLTQTQRASEGFDFQRQEGRFTDRANVIGTDIAAASTGMGRTLARGGNAALNPDLLSLSLSAVTTAQNKLDFDRMHYGGNQQLLASDRLGVRQAQEGRDEFLDRYNTYAPTGVFARRMMNDEAGAQMAQLLPFSDGVDPLTASRKLTSDYRQDLTQLNANRADRQKQGLWRDEDETRYEAQKNADNLQIARLGHDEQRSWLSMLPETVAGMPLAAGVGSAAIPRASMAAYYSPSGINGSFGPAGSPSLAHNPMFQSLGLAAHPGASAPGLGHPAVATTAARNTGGGGSPIDYNPRGHHYSSDPASHDYIGMVTPGIGHQFSSDPHSREYAGIVTDDGGHHYSNNPHSQEFMGMVSSSSFFVPSAAPSASRAAMTPPSPSAGSASMSMGGMTSGAAPSRRSEDLLERAVRALESLERSGARFHATPPGNTVGAAVQMGGQSRNPYTGR